MENLEQDYNQGVEENKEVAPKANPNRSVYIIIAIIASVALVLSAIVIGFAIIYTGLNLEKKLDKLQSVNTNAEQQPSNEPVDISITESMPRLGNADAPVVLVEYADYQCPFCGKFFSETFSKLKTEFIDTGKIRFYYQDFAFLGEESQFAAEAAKCAKEQGKFWEYHDYLYTHQDGENEGAFTQVNLKKFAAELGLDQTKFNNCVDSRVYKPDVEAESSQGQSYGVSATPTVFINGQKYEGAQDFDVYKQAIEKALQN